MDSLDKINMIQLIVEHVYKYDDEGRRTNLTAAEVVEYAKTLTKFITSGE